MADISGTKTDHKHWCVWDHVYEGRNITSDDLVQWFSNFPSPKAYLTFFCIVVKFQKKFHILSLLISKYKN